MSMGIFPKPQPSWPMWAHVLYWSVVGIILLVMLGGTLIKMFKFIKKGRAGILVRRGYPVLRGGEPVRKGPGIHPVIPFIDSIDDECVLDRVSNCSAVLAENNKTQRQYAAEVRPTWCVIDTPWGLHNALFKADKLEEIVETEIMCAIGVAIEDAENVRSRKEIMKRARKECVKYLRKTYGVDLRKLGLVSVVRVPVQVLGDTLGTNTTDGVTPAVAGAKVRQLGAAMVGSEAV